jgi:acyl-CoA dehydrogenase
MTATWDARPGSREPAEARWPGLAAVLDAARAAAADEAADFPAGGLMELRASGLLGLLVPGEHGGLSGDLTDLAEVTMRLARENTSLAFIFAMHCQQVAAIVRYAQGPMREQVLPDIARGRIYLASATTETGTGSHLLTSRSVTEAVAGLLRIDRDAPVVTGGEHADGFLITVQAPRATSPHEVLLVYAHRSQLGLRTLGGWQPMGMGATRSVPMRLTGEVPMGQILPARGGFHEIVTALYGPVAHIGWSATWLGTSAGALSRVVRYLRSHGGRAHSDLSSELLLTRLAKVRARLDTVHAMLRHVLAASAYIDDPSRPPYQLLANGLKVIAAEQCFDAVHELMELAGLRLGYMRDSALGLERAFRDLRSATLNYGNDRLYLIDGSLTLLDQDVCLA